MNNIINHPTKVWNPKLYDSNARFVSDLATDVLMLLAPKPSEKILDIGCGDGKLTKIIKDSGCDVIGLDSSPEFISSTLDLGIEAVLGNAQEIKFDDVFHAVFSNAALHWVKDQKSLLEGVYKSLKYGGRFVAEMGGAGNCSAIIKAIELEINKYGFSGDNSNPWYFPSVIDYKTKLEKVGFKVNYIELINRPTKLPGDVGGWMDVFCDSFFELLNKDQKILSRKNIINDLKYKISDDDGVWWADYVRLRFSAEKYVY